MVTKYRKTPLRLGEKDVCSFSDCIFYSLLSIVGWYLKNKNEIKIPLNPLKNSTYIIIYTRVKSSL